MRMQISSFVAVSSFPFPIFPYPSEFVPFSVRLQGTSSRTGNVRGIPVSPNLYETFSFNFPTRFLVLWCPDCSAERDIRLENGFFLAWFLAPRMKAFFVFTFHFFDRCIFSRSLVFFKPLMYDVCIDVKFFSF